MTRIGDLASKLLRREAHGQAGPGETGIRHLVLGLTKQGAIASEAQLVRRAALGVARALGKPGEFLSFMGDVLDLERQVDAMLASHAPPEDIRDGRGGTFDSCDLRHWIALAERAGVSHVPAREILTLSSDEIGLLQGPVRLPSHVARGLAARLEHLKALVPDADASGAPLPPDDAARRAVIERIFAAGDMIPPGHVVRSAIAGPNSMKAMAGTGTLRDQDTAVRFNDVTVGCGWIRQGNRTRIDVTDERITALQARGHEDTFRFLVRPWVDAGRRNQGEDPHFGTKANSGQTWPAEWRVFVKNGEVIAVGNYYAWAGGIDRQAARGALAAKAAAEKIVAAALEAGAHPVTTDLWISHRHPPEEGKDNLENFQNREFPLEGFHCTLDFIEGPEGEAILLEGGPPHLPTGMGHPVAFAGCRLREDSPGYCDLRGVAFGLAEGVNIADVRTWKVRSADHALSFEEAARLAEPDDSPSP